MLLIHFFDCLPLLLVPSIFYVAMHDSQWLSISVHSSQVAEPCHPSFSYLVNYCFFLLIRFLLSLLDSPSIRLSQHNISVNSNVFSSAFKF